MTQQEATHHHLQIAGTKDRPDPGAHLGTLASYPECKVAFDLVPDESVNGSGAEQMEWAGRTGPPGRFRKARVPPRTGGRPLPVDLVAWPTC